MSFWRPLHPSSSTTPAKLTQCPHFLSPNVYQCCWITPATVPPLSPPDYTNSSPPFLTSTTILLHSNSEHKHRLNSRHGTDPTVCLGTYGEPTEVNVLTVIQPLREGRSTILMYMFELARCHKCGYSAGCYELSKLPRAGQPIETCCKSDKEQNEWKDCCEACCAVMLEIIFWCPPASSTMGIKKIIITMCFVWCTKQRFIFLKLNIKSSQLFYRNITEQLLQPQVQKVQETM